MDPGGGGVGPGGGGVDPGGGGVDPGGGGVDPGGGGVDPGGGGADLAGGGVDPGGGGVDPGRRRETWGGLETGQVLWGWNQRRVWSVIQRDTHTENHCFLFKAARGWSPLTDPWICPWGCAV